VVLIYKGFFTPYIFEKLSCIEPSLIFEMVISVPPD